MKTKLYQVSKKSNNEKALKEAESEITTKKKYEALLCTETFLG